GVVGCGRVKIDGHIFAVVCPLDQVGTRIKARYGNAIDRISFYTPYTMDAEAWQAVLAGFR
ncbi:MAG: hypothetical protein ACLQRH_09985, partial [Acidimicrobiales bacterium]